jgi:hypothetical protein
VNLRLLNFDRKYITYFLSNTFLAEAFGACVKHRPARNGNKYSDFSDFAKVYSVLCVSPVVSVMLSTLYEQI